MADRECSVEGCSRVGDTRGMCNKHSLRLKRHGNPAITMYRVTSRGASLADRLLECSDRTAGTDGCWPYIGGNRSSLGYGRFMHQRERDGAHRWAWREANGRDVPDGLVVRHKCDNPPCMNPSHLELGTHKENAQDIKIRGRSANMKGEMAGRAILTWAQVNDIRRLAAEGVSVSALAPLYPVTKGHLRNIVNGRAWTAAA
jgi:hypothetical protein